MDDLISRAAAIERMKSMAGCATCDTYNYVRCRACIWDDAMNIVEEMPKVDAVPVIRCRDCKHSIENAKHIDVACEMSYDPDFYCAAGERKDSE